MAQKTQNHEFVTEQVFILCCHQLLEMSSVAVNCSHIVYILKVDH